MILISSHARFSDDGHLVHGTSSQLIAYLQKKKNPYASLFHSLFPGFPTLVEYAKEKRKIGLSNLPFTLKLMQDVCITFFYIWKYKNVIEIYIGMNPINGAIGSLCKKLGVLRKAVYYTADFSFRRFQNPILNAIYLFLDDFSVKHADVVWNVSTRIQKERIKKYITQEKFFILPNSLPIPKIKRKKKHDKYALILVTHMTKSIHFDMLISAASQLRKSFPKFTLHIVGDGPEENRIKLLVEKMHLGKIVLFHGYLSHVRVTDLLTVSGIGLGIYTNDNPWTRYGDSMKVREYVAYGLPVIITNVPSTAEDILNYQAGIVIKQTKKDFVKAVKELLSRKYEKYRKNALHMARETDYAKLLDIALVKLRS